MPTFVVRGPDGKTHKVNAPKGATQEQAIAFVAQTKYDNGQTKSVLEDYLEEVPILGDLITGTADIGLGLTKGAASGVGAIADAFGAGNDTSKFFKSIATGAEALMSAQERGDLATGRRIMKEAEDKGVPDQLMAAAQAFSKSPLTMGAEGLGSAAPLIGASLATKGTAIPALLGGAMGAGAVKGSIYDSVKQAAIEKGVSPEAAKAMAEEAQSYLGENTDMVALGTVLGVVAGRLGVEASVARILGKDIAETAIQRSLVGGAVRGAAAEAAPEALQAGQERLSGNLAADRAGFDTPLMRGVAGQAALEGFMGGVPGAAIGATEARLSRGEDAPVPPPPTEPSAGPSVSELVKQVFTTPEQMAEFTTLTAQLTNMYGIPEEQAGKIAFSTLRPTTPDTPAAPATGEVSSAVEPTIAPAPTPSVEPPPVIPPIETVTPEAQVAKQLAEVGVPPPAPAVGPAAPIAAPAVEPTTPTPVPAEAAPVVEPAAPVSLSLPDATRKVTPDRIAAAREMLATTLATPEFEGVEVTRKELTAAANKMARTPGLEAPAVLTEVLGIDAMEAAEAAPAPEELPEPVLEAPTEAPAPLDVSLPEPEATPVPITKVAPGDARGSRPVQRGTQGTQRGRPVEGAAQVTAGMKAQQDLTFALEAARDAREVTDQEAAEVLGVLRAPRTEQELRTLPVARRNQWVEVNALQKQVDDLQQRVNEIPKEVLGQPNPARVDMEAALGGVQQRLDTAQQGIVNEARAVFEAKRTGRKAGAAAIRERLRDKNLTPKERRDLQISLRETSVQRAQKGKTARVDTRTPEQVEAELEGRSANEVLDWLVDTAPNKALATIARAVRNALNRQQRLGWTVDFKIVRQSSEAPSDTLALLDGIASAVTNLQYGTNNTTVYLNPAAMGDTAGTNYETILHEFIHAATSPYLDFALEPDFIGTRTARLGEDLRAVLAAIQNHLVRERGQYEGYSDAELYVGDGANIFNNEHELLAWALSNPKVMEYLNTVPYKGKQTIFQRFVEVVRNILGLSANSDSALAEVLRIGEELLSTGDREAGRLLNDDPNFNRTLPQKKAKKEKPNKGLVKAQLANQAAGFTAGLDAATAQVKLDAQEKRKAFLEASVSGGFRPATLAITPTSWIRDAITKIRPGLGSIVEGIAKLEQNMRGMRTSMERAMRRRVHDVEKFVNKNGQAELSAMMTIARVNRFDVTAFDTRAEALAKDKVLQHHVAQQNAKGAKKRTEDINVAWDAWDALGKQPNGHAVYKMMRQFYRDMYTALRAAQDEDIRSLGLDKAATEKLIKQARGDIDEDAVVEEGEHKGVPENLFPAEYFPFRRFGEYALLVKTGKRAERERYHFESAQERNEFEALRAKQLGLKRGTDEYNEAFSRLDGLENMRDNMTEESFLLGKLFSAIDETKSPEGGTPEDTAKFRKSVKDRLYQTYLMTLPERSLRKQFIHAELVTGQSADALRVFRVSAGQYAGQLPKVTFGGKIQTQIEAAYDSIKEGDPAERAKLTQMVNTIVSRTRDALDPPQRSKLEQRINEFTFLSLMTSIASAAVQPLTLPLQVMPRMVARYGPMQALKMVSGYTPMLQAVKAWVDVDPTTGVRTLVAPTLANVDYIKNNPLRARLWKELDQNRDLFSQKQVDMLLRNRATAGTTAATPGARLVGGYEKMVTASGALFSSMDQMTREISGMSFAELEYNRLKKLGKSHEAAIAGAVEAAVRNTNETIGDYTEVEKLDVFRGGPLRRMMGFLRTYAVQRTAYYFRMTDALYQGAPTQTRLQAFHELSMVLGFTALAAGLGANFGYKFITEVIDLMLPMFVGEDDMEEWRKKDPLGADSTDYRLRFQWLPSQFGDDYPMAVRVAQRGALSEITGYDWTTRLSQSSMWLRDFQKGDDLQETIVNFLVSNLAPQVSQGANIIDGIDEFTRGNWSKGFTKIMPAAVRGAFTASRYTAEGETTKSGLSVRGADEFTTNELVGQVLGFSPNELAKVREINRKSQAWKRAMEDERGSLFKEYRDVMDDPETTQEDVDVVVEKIIRFNSKVPLDPNGRPMSAYLIEAKDVSKSVRGREQRETKSVRGVEYAPGEYETLFGGPPK